MEPLLFLPLSHIVTHFGAQFHASSAILNVAFKVAVDTLAFTAAHRSSSVSAHCGLAIVGGDGDGGNVSTDTDTSDTGLAEGSGGKCSGGGGTSSAGLVGDGLGEDGVFGFTVSKRLTKDKGDVGVTLRLGTCGGASIFLNFTRLALCPIK